MSATATTVDPTIASLQAEIERLKRENAKLRAALNYSIPKGMGRAE